MTRLLPALALALAAATGTPGCQMDDPVRPGAAAQPLIGGQVDTGDEAAVALTRGTGPFCTGTLVSPSVVVTAAHCVDMLAGDPGVIVFFGSDTSSDGRKVGVRAAMAQPDWTGSLADGHDIGVVLLNFPQDPFLPIPLNTDALPDHIGEPIRRIGFGISDRGPPPVIDGKKRTGTTTLNVVPDGYDYFLAGDDNLTTCNGDSGGTSLITIDGEERLAGVHSFGFDNGGTICIPPSNGDTRVALYVQLVPAPVHRRQRPGLRRRRHLRADRLHRRSRLYAVRSRRQLHRRLPAARPGLPDVAAGRAVPGRQPVRERTVHLLAGRSGHSLLQPAVRPVGRRLPAGHELPGPPGAGQRLLLRRPARGSCRRPLPDRHRLRLLRLRRGHLRDPV